MNAPPGLVVGNPVLGLHAQTIGQSVDVSVVTHNLGNIEDVSVRKSLGAQQLDIACDHVAWIMGELDRIGEHRAPFVRQGRALPAILDRLVQGLIFEEPAQTTPVVKRSIMASVLDRHHVGNELALDLAKRRRARHGRLIQRVVCCERSRIEGLNRHDVVDPAIAGVHDAVVLVSQVGRF